MVAAGRAKSAKFIGSIGIIIGIESIVIDAVNVAFGEDQLSWSDVGQYYNVLPDVDVRLTIDATCVHVDYLGLVEIKASKIKQKQNFLNLGVTYIGKLNKDATGIIGI